MFNHIPLALLAEENASNDVLLSVFAGYSRPEDPGRSFKQIIAAHKVAKKLRVMASNRRLRHLTSSFGTFLPAQWMQLDHAAQLKLRDLLAWENLSRWDFDMFEVDKVVKGKHTLVLVAWAILASPQAQYAMDLACQEIPNHRNGPAPTSLADRKGYRFIDQFGIEAESLLEFLQAIENRYVDTPYHNKVHAADVTQSLHSILQMGGEKYASEKPLELFAVLLASVIHDVGHPGTNNLYHVNAKSDIAIRYNDLSVLENMHIATAFEIIMGTNREEKADILASFTEEQKNSIRSLVIKAVLATDMTKHFSKKNLIKGLLLNKVAAEDPTSLAKDDLSRHEILSFMLHLADISNPAKIIQTGSQWTDRVLEEFFLQGDKESGLGLPISPLCDRKTTSRPQSQIGFITFIVLPAYEVLGQLVPRVSTEVVPIITDNLKYWKEQKRLETEAENDDTDGT